MLVLLSVPDSGEALRTINTQFIIAKFIKNKHIVFDFCIFCIIQFSSAYTTYKCTNWCEDILPICTHFFSLNFIRKKIS